MIFKIIGIGIIGTIIVGLLKGMKSELSVYVSVATCIIIIINVLNGFVSVVETFNGIIDKTGIDSGLFSGVLKIIGVGYVTEYSAEICRDSGGESIASKITLGGKIAIFLLALPILNKLVEIVVALIP